MTSYDQDALLELQDALGARLDYFAELEHATRMLNHPGEALVLQTDFLYMVERVDVCIEFLKGHVRSLSRSFSHRVSHLRVDFFWNSAITRKQTSTFSVLSNA